MPLLQVRLIGFGPPEASTSSQDAVLTVNGKVGEMVEVGRRKRRKGFVGCGSGGGEEEGEV